MAHSSRSATQDHSIFLRLVRRRRQHTTTSYFSYADKLINFLKATARRRASVRSSGRQWTLHAVLPTSKFPPSGGSSSARREHHQRGVTVPPALGRCLSFLQAVVVLKKLVICDQLMNDEATSVTLCQVLRTALMFHEAPDIHDKYFQ